MIYVTRIFALALVFIGISACMANDSTLTVTANDGTEHLYHIEYAVTMEEKARGLMFRETMPDNHGMLFIYDTPQIAKFWMRNTLIPLDMLFFDADQTLVHIERNAIPHDESPRGPNVPICYVLEVNAGQAARLNITKGAKFFAKLPQQCLLME